MPDAPPPSSPHRRDRTRRTHLKRATRPPARATRTLQLLHPWRSWRTSGGRPSERTAERCRALPRDGRPSGGRRRVGVAVMTVVATTDVRPSSGGQRPPVMRSCLRSGGGAPVRPSALSRWRRVTARWGTNVDLFDLLPAAGFRGPGRQDPAPCRGRHRPAGREPTAAAQRRAGLRPAPARASRNIAGEPAVTRGAADPRRDRAGQRRPDRTAGLQRRRGARTRRRCSRRAERHSRKLAEGHSVSDAHAVSSILSRPTSKPLRLGGA